MEVEGGGETSQVGIKSIIQTSSTGRKSLGKWVILREKF